MPAIALKKERKTSSAEVRGAYRVTLHGRPLRPGMKVKIEFWEVDSRSKGGSGDELLGATEGTLELASGNSRTPSYSVKPTGAAPQPKSGARVEFVFPLSSGKKSVIYDLPRDRHERDEGDQWEVQARVADLDLRSPIERFARVRRALPVRGAKKVATYNWYRHNDVEFYNDASVDAAGSAGAFYDIEKAIKDARQFVFIADWSFHPYTRLRHEPNAKLDQTIGRVLRRQAQANAELLVAIHTWDHTNVGAPDWANDWGEEGLKILCGGTRPANLLWRASSRTGEGGGAGVGWTHHQKFVVLDVPAADGRREIRAFFGGLDLTKGRFDWPEHPIGPRSSKKVAGFLDQVGGKKPGTFKDKNHDYDDWYNAELGEAHDLRQPWHDIHAQITGPTAWDFIREFVGRWNLDPSWADAQGDDSSDDIKTVLKKFKALFDKKTFVQQWEGRKGRWAGQVYRSMVKEHWGSKDPVETPGKRKKTKEFQWTVEHDDVESSIREAYIQSIRQAERFLYIETQYLVGSGKMWGNKGVRNSIPEEIVKRTVARIDAGLPFHTYFVLPMFPEGDPVSAAVRAVRRFQWDTAKYMVKAVAKKAGAKWKDYLSFYFLAQWQDLGGKPLTTKGDRKDKIKANKRYMIYVHSKMMIVDDRYLIIGSANLNERSLAGGRDSEICVGLWPSSDRTEAECVEQVQRFRKRLWTEHLGAGLPGSWKAAESPECVQAVRRAALKNYIHFREGRREAGDAHLAIWPIESNARDDFYYDKVSRAPEGDFRMPDGKTGPRDTDWLWSPVVDLNLIKDTDIAE